MLVSIDRDGNRVVVAVQDFGIGIMEEELPTLFDGFSRGSNAAAIPGTGLGLSIVRKAIEALNGELEIKSELNLGSTFKVSLKLL